MIKTFDHATIYNGEYYAANTPIEVCEESPEASNNRKHRKKQKSKPRQRLKQEPKPRQRLKKRL